MAPMLNTPHSDFQADQKRFVVPQITNAAFDGRTITFGDFEFITFGDFKVARLSSSKPAPVRVISTKVVKKKKKSPYYRVNGVSLLKGESLASTSAEWWHQFSGTIWPVTGEKDVKLVQIQLPKIPERVSKPVSEERLQRRRKRAWHAAIHHEWIKERTYARVDILNKRISRRARRLARPDFEAQMAGLTDFFRPTVNHNVNVSFDFSEFERLAKSALSAAESAFVIATGGSGRTGEVVRRILKALVPVVVIGTIVYTAKVSLSFVLSLFRRIGCVICDYFVSDKYEPQFGEKGECATFGKLALAALAAWMLGKKNAVAAMVTLVSKFAPFVAGATTMAEVFMEFAQWTVDKLMHLLGGEPIEFFRKRAKQVTEWIGDVMREISSTDNEVGKPERVVRLYKDGLMLKAEYVNTPAYSDIERAFRELDRVYNSYAAALAQMKASRPEPLCFVLQGDPGVGKSAMLAMLHGYVMAYLYPDEVRKCLEQGIDVSSMMFQKDPGPYFDGYDPERHKTFAIDDGGTAIPVAGVPDNDYMTVMRVINTAPCPLEMAELSGKGTTYFRSALVLITTNLTTEQWTRWAEMVVTTPAAVVRRLRMFASVKVKQDRTGPSGIKIRPECCEQEDSWMITIKQEGSETRSFDNIRVLARHIADEMLQRNAVHQGLLNAVRTGISEILDQPLEPQMGFLDWWTGMNEEERKQHKDMLEHVKRFRDFNSWKSERENASSWFPNAASVTKLPVEALTASDYIDAYIRDAKRLMRIGSQAAVSLATKVWFEDVARLGQALVRYYNKYEEGIICFLTTFVFTLGTPFLIAIFLRLMHAMGYDTGLKLKSEVKTPIAVTSQFADAEQADQEIALKLAKNSYNVSIIVDGETVLAKAGRILFIQGRLAVLPHHYFRYFATYIAKFEDRLDTAFLRFTNIRGETFLEPLSRFSSVGAVKGFCKMDDDGVMEDAVMMRFNTHEHTSLAGRFISSTDIYKDHESMYWVSFRDKDVDLNVVRGRFDAPVRYRDSLMSATNCVRQSIKYSIACEKGDCGNVILVRNPSCGSRRIAGIHVAGDTGTKQGLGVVLTDEWVTTALNKCSEVNVSNSADLTQECVEPATYEPHVYGQDDMGQFITHHLLVKSGSSPALEGPSLVKGTVHGWAPCEKVPAKTDYRSTKSAMFAYGGLHKLNDAHFDIYKAAAEQTLHDTGCPAHLNNRKLSILEAMKGSNVWGRFAEPINTKTSPGFPWRNVGIPKSRLFDSKTGEVKVSSQAFVMLCDNVMTLLEKARRGEDLLVVFQISPKPELRKPGKPPRIIQGAPLHYVVAWRVLFWSLMMHYAKWAPEKEAAIGLNPMAHWDTLVKFICPNRHEARVGAGDYKNFDQSHEPVISRAIGEAVIERYPDDGWATARRQMWKCLCAPHVTFGGLVYKLDRGLPSGHPATALVNSLYNSTLFRLCYISQKTRAPGQVFGDNALRAIAHLPRFASKVRLAVLGDDNLFGSDDPDFNELVLPELMDQFGATYTLDVKDAGPAIRPFRLISEVTFVGRAFNYDPSELAFLPSLRIESIWQQGQYALKKAQVCDEWHRATYRSVLGELSYHPQQIWNEWAPRALAAWSTLGISLPGPHVYPSPTSRAYWRGDYESESADWN